MNLLKSVLLSLVVIFAPAKTVMITTFALCVADLISGLLAAKRQNIAITSFGLKRTVVKLLVYEAAILLGYLVGAYLVPEAPILNIVTSMIGLTELKSILENIDLIARKPILKSIIDTLQKKSSNNEEA